MEAYGLFGAVQGRMTAFDPASFDIPRAQNEALILRPSEDPKPARTTAACG